MRATDIHLHRHVGTDLTVEHFHLAAHKTHDAATYGWRRDSGCAHEMYPLDSGADGIAEQSCAVETFRGCDIDIADAMVLTVVVSIKGAITCGGTQFARLRILLSADGREVRALEVNVPSLDEIGVLVGVAVVHVVRQLSQMLDGSDFVRVALRSAAASKSTLCPRRGHREHHQHQRNAQALPSAPKRLHQHPCGGVKFCSSFFHCYVAFFFLFLVITCPWTRHAYSVQRYGFILNFPINQTEITVTRKVLAPLR